MDPVAGTSPEVTERAPSPGGVSGTGTGTGFGTGTGGDQVAPVAEAPPARLLEELRWGLRVSVLPWVVARVAVLGALATARELSTRAGLGPAATARVHQGLLGWDAGWYLSIARHGYSGAGPSSLRFFPVVPAVARLLGLGVGPSAGLLGLANGAAVVGVVGLAVLVRREVDADLARRTVWLACLAPAAFTEVMGYAESTLLVCTVLAFGALRRQRWWWAAAAGLVAGATRPLGVVLVVPAAIEVLGALVRSVRASGRPPLRRLAGMAAGVVAPAAGAGAYLAWVGWRFGDALAPVHLQTRAKARGSFGDPLPVLWRDAKDLLHGQHLGEALHLPWVLLAIALIVVAARRLPVSYTAFAAAIVVIAVANANLDSFERYALSAWPLVVAASSLTERPSVERAVLGAATAGLVAYALLAFTNVLVP